MTASPTRHGLLFFPCLHPALAPAAVPASVRFLDPGMADPADSRSWRPDGLPLSAGELAGFVREFERLRREVKNPKDIALLADASNGHFFAATSFALREELEDQLHPERVARRRLTAAQLSLCLSSMVEESLLELSASADVETRFRAALAESLGLDACLGEEADEAEDLAALVAAQGPVLPAAALVEEFGLPWRRLLSPFWALAPSEAGFFVTDAEIAATWLDAGIALAEPVPGELEALFAGNAPDGPVLVARETGWRLLGKSRPNPEAPWLDVPRTVVVLKP